MNFDFYLFGTPDGYDQYPLDDKETLFQSFFDKDSPVQLSIYRNAELVYFTYIRNINTNMGKFFGMSIVFNGAYPNNLGEVFSVFDSLFDRLVNKGRFLREDKSGLAMFTGIRLAEAQDEIEELSRYCRTLVQSRLDRLETRLPKEYVVQERTASFAFDSNYLPTPLGELLKYYKRITLTKGKANSAQTENTSHKKETKWLPFVIGVLVFVLLVGAFLLYNSNSETTVLEDVKPSVSESTDNRLQQEELNSELLSKPEIIDSTPKQQEKQKEISNVTSNQSTETSFPYDSYFLGTIGSKGVLAIDDSGGGYCTYNRNDTDLTRNIKVDKYYPSTGKLIIKAYDRQGHYVGKFDGYTRNNNSYIGTFTIEGEDDPIGFNLQVKAQPNGSGNSTGKYVVIDGSDLRLRRGPSLGSDTYKWPDGHNRHPNAGEKFRYLGESGDFYKIDFNDTVLWVSKHHTHRED